MRAISGGVRTIVSAWPAPTSPPLSLKENTMRVVATTTMTQNSGVRRMRLKSMCVRGAATPSLLLDQRTRRALTGRDVVDDGTRA